MMSIVRSLMIGSFLVGCATAGAIPPAQAQSSAPNVLVFTEDADRDTVPRNSRVNRQVLQEVQNAFNQAGYRYFDEVAIGLDYFAPDRTRRPRQELIKIARSVDTPIDIAVVYYIYASAKNLDFMTEASMRIEGELIDVSSGQGLGNFEVASGRKFKLPVDCSRECVLEEMSAEARPLGRDLGQALVRLINQRWVPSSTAGSTTAATTSGNDSGMGFVRLYDLCFDNFTQDQMLDVEELVVSFGGYRSHRVARTQATRTCYQYESSSEQARIMRNLKRMVDYMDVTSDIKSDGGTSVEVIAEPEIRLHPVNDRPVFE